MFGRTSIWEDFKSRILKQGDILTRLIFINAAVFVLINLLKVFLVLFQLDMTIYIVIWNFLAVSADPMKVLVKPWTIITYIFVHSGFFHILWNMLILYWFGRVFREFLGDKKLLSTFLIGGIAGAIIFLIAYQVFPFLLTDIPPMGMVGASAGVLAVLVASATLVPDYTFHLLFFGPVRIKYIALVLVIIDLISLAGSNAGGHFAHIGGAIYGYVYIRQLQRGNDLGQWLITLIDKIKLAFTPTKSHSSNFKVHRNKKPGKSPENMNQKEIDRILDKIAESGYDSLTDDERDILFKASKNN